MPIHMSEGRERVRQQPAFSCGCVTASWLLHFKAGQSWRSVHFSAFNTSLPAEALPGKMQLPFFSSFKAVMPKWKADERRALGHQ